MSHFQSAHSWSLPDGTPLTLRPVQPHDAPALKTLIENLPERDLRWRFHGAVTGVPAPRLRRMACVDPQREVGLVVCADRSQTLVADARFVVDDNDADSAEFALMVAAAWQRCGIGLLALAALQQAAAERGLHWLHGSVCADNTPMLSLLRRAGFHCRLDRGDRTLMVAEIGLQPPHAVTEPALSPLRWWRRPPIGQALHH